MAQRRKNRLSLEEYIAGILAGNNVVLSRAITLIESALPSDNELAEKIIQQVLPKTGNSIRIGITGVPGVGKSTFIESFGTLITSLNKKLAVLAIDPTSQRSQGSILGDKTRMEQLAHDPLAYIRPSAAGSALGGVGHKTREAMLLCEAAGYKVIIIETVGVGQSEIAVKGMVDFFMLLMLAGAGDELQGIKKGIMEMADLIAINKADGENQKVAQKAKAQYLSALHLFPAASSEWNPTVVTCSALKNEGILDIWKIVMQHNKVLSKKGLIKATRQEQNLDWMQQMIRFFLGSNFYNSPQVQEQKEKIEQQVLSGEIPSITGARQLLAIFED